MQQSNKLHLLVCFPREYEKCNIMGIVTIEEGRLYITLQVSQSILSRKNEMTKWHDRCFL